MSLCVLITGGSRSGKSSYAQQWAESLPGARGFVATCPVIDAEMEDRVEAHRHARMGQGWHTIEEPLHLASAIRNAKHLPVLLVDCLTLWVNNLLFEAEQRGETLSEDSVSIASREVLQAAREHGGTILFVTNELGMGIIPENRQARLFKDLAGRANQVVAHECEQVFFVVCGQPLRMKGEASAQRVLHSLQRKSDQTD